MQAVIGQTPGQLIDLHYVNYSGDVERRMKNGSHSRVILSECTVIKLSADLETSLSSDGAA